MAGLLRRSRGALFMTFVVVAPLPFVMHSVLRGVSLGTELEQATSRLISSDVGATLSIYVHMVLGGLLTLLAPLQLSQAVRARRPVLHRANGRLVGTLAIITGLTGLYYIARQGTIGGPWMNVGFAIYGALLILAAAQTLRFAVRRDARHAAWAGRLIILALASFFYRVQYTIWAIIAGEAGMEPDFSGAFDRVMVFGFYVPWLILYEVVRLRRGPRPVPGLAPQKTA
ncbi:MAG: DUF2306 domain-containing protein [Pseudomonadota bacterium]